MSEYPTRQCGPCPHLATFQPPTDGNTFLQTNTMPHPKFQLTDHQKIDSPSLGVSSTNLKPDLSVPPEESYKGGIPPCDLSNQIQGNCCSQSESPNVKKETLKSILKKETGPSSVEEMHAAAEKSKKQVNLRPPLGDDKTNPPCYLPQPHDSLPHPLEEGMGPVGPWATGRIDWGPLSGLTGIRPVVDKYSIARYSEGDWRSHNKQVLDTTHLELHRADLIDWNGIQCLDTSFSDVDADQTSNTRRLNTRETELHRWKCELERAIAAASEEISFMEEQRHRLKQASKVLTLPESISGEILERRTGRMDSELVRDELEEELIKEVALCAEIREMFSRTLKDVEKQLVEDKTAKQRLEYDWSDKKVSHDIESINVALNNMSTTLMFNPGSVGFSNEQSTPQYWEHFTRDTLLEGEATRQRSVTLRGTLDNILDSAAKDLRAQADKVEAAMSSRVKCVEEVTKRLEEELIEVLERLAKVEGLIEKIRVAIRKMDTPMKKAQTRLHNRSLRPRVEDCRDEAHFGLVEEVKKIGEAVGALQAQLHQAEESQARLTKARGELEREIMLKRGSLEIDRERSRRIRSFYPSAAALAGH